MHRCMCCSAPHKARRSISSVEMVYVCVNYKIVSSRRRAVSSASTDEDVVCEGEKTREEREERERRGGVELDE